MELPESPCRDRKDGELVLIFIVTPSRGFTTAHVPLSPGKVVTNALNDTGVPSLD